jgi:hypothetical protein
VVMNLECFGKENLGVYMQGGMHGWGRGKSLETWNDLGGGTWVDMGKRACTGRRGTHVWGACKGRRAQVGRTSTDGHIRVGGMHR